MSEWNHINFPLYGINSEVKEEKIKQINLIKPKKPSLEREATKILGFNKNSLQKLKEYDSFSRYNYLFLKESYVSEHFLNVVNSNDFKKYFDAFGDPSYENIKNSNSYYYHSNLAIINLFRWRKKSQCLELISFAEKFNKYLKWIENHPETIKYNESIKEYSAKNLEINNESKFSKSEFSAPGTLVQLYSEKRDEWFSFLIGSSGSALDLKLKFPKSSYPDIKIVRCKKIIDEQDIVGDLIFM